MLSHAAWWAMLPHVAPCSSEDVLVVLLSVYFDRDVISIISKEINHGFRLCLQCNPMGDVVPCSLMGDVVPRSPSDVLITLLSVYFDKDVFLIVSHEINIVFCLCLQCNPMGDFVPCVLMGDVIPCRSKGVLVVLLSVYFDKDVFLIVSVVLVTISHEVNVDFRFGLQNNPMDDAVPCVLIGDVLP